MSDPAQASYVSDPVDNLPFRRDALTWLMYGMLGVYNYLLSGLGPLMPALRQELDLSYTVTSLHFSAWAVGMILAGIVGDRLVRAWGRCAVFWTGAAGLTLGAVALTLARQPMLTIGSVLLMGAVGSLALVLIPAVLADRHGARRTLAIVEANILAAATGALAGVLIGLGQATPPVGVDPGCSSFSCHCSSSSGTGTCRCLRRPRKPSSASAARVCPQPTGPTGSRWYWRWVWSSASSSGARIS